MFMALRHSYKRNKTQSPLGTMLRWVLACLAALIALANAGCVNDDTTDLSAGRSAEQCELENNQRANNFYKNAAGQYATTMRAGAALNIHTGCSTDPTYSWESPY